MATTDTLCVCSFFRAEADSFVQAKGLQSQYSIKAFPAFCHGIPATGPAFQLRSAATVPDSGNQEKPTCLLFVGKLCPVIAKGVPETRKLQGNQHRGGISSGACLSLIAPEWLLENLVREGSYLVSPGWLADWEKNVAAWGFDATSLREFARDSMKQVCLLDTFSLPGIGKHLAEFSEALGLPALRIPVGMTHYGTILQATIDAQSTEPLDTTARQEKPKPSADYAMALDLLSRLGHFQSEREVIAQLLEILSMLFAPGSLSLVSYENENPVKLWMAFSGETLLDKKTASICRSFSTIYTLHDYDGGFVLPIDFNGKRMAFVFLNNLAVPESKGSYRNLIESIIPLFSLSLKNARNYEALVRNETALIGKQKELLDTLEFRDRLLAIIGHDLRGPIGSMGDWLKLLGESLEGSIPEREMQFLSEIILAAQSASNLLLNLLEWAKHQNAALEFTREHLVVRDEIEAIYTILQSQAAGKDIKLHNAADPDFHIFADSNVIQTILRNLVSNALKFSRPGGTVTIRTSQAGGTRRIDIMDSGVGMDAETLARVLDFSKRRSMKGTKGERGSGLGLVFCKELAQKSGANITIDSNPGEGTTVSLVFQEPV